MKSERQEALQVNYLHSSSARKESFDSGVGSDVESDYWYSTDDTEPLIPKSKSKDPEVIKKTSDDIHTALKAVKKGKRKFEKWQKKGSIDISNIRDEKENNILHRIALLKKKQKCRSLNILVEKFPKEDLKKLVDSENKEGKTPLQVALIDKITKGKHGAHIIQSNDNTLKFLVALLEHEAKPDQLELPKETLQGLDEEQKIYYLNFLEKLAESIRKPELEPEIETKIKEIITHTTNTPDSNGSYLLDSAVKNKDEKLFKRLLQKGADISLKNSNGNNALHLIVTELKRERKLGFLNIISISEEEGKEQLKTQFKEAIDAKNAAKQTPLHQVLKRVQEKSKESLLGNKIQNVVKKEFNATSRYRTLKLFLQNGADISKEDGEGNNTLHYIASFKGKQKVACLELTLGKDGFSKAVNATNEKGQTPLHQLLQCMGEKSGNRSLKKFEETNRYKALELFLQNGADITAQDEEGNNVLHYIALFKGKQKVACLELIVKLSQDNISLKAQLREAVNAKNQKEEATMQTALTAKATKDTHNPIALEDNTIKFCERLLQEGADSSQLELSESNLFKEQKAYWHNFLLQLNKSVQNSELDPETKKLVMINTTEIADSSISEFNKLLKSGCDITSQDEKGNNVLHRIASLEKGQKVARLKSILDLVEKGVISKAVNVRNHEGYTPIQVALVTKIQKEKHNIINPKSRDNTIEFCAILLQNGAKPDDLKLTKELHNQEHYRFLCKLEEFDSIPRETREKIKKIRKDFKTKYGYQSKAQEFFKSVCEFMDPAKRTRELLAITVTITVIAMAAFAFFQGQVGIGAAIPIIAVAGVICLTLTLGFSGIKKLFENSTDKIKNSIGNDQQNLGNDSKSLEVKEQQDQSKNTRSPNSKMEGISVEPHVDCCKTRLD